MKRGVKLLVRPFRRLSVGGLIAAATWLAVLVAAVAWLGWLWWPFELLAHFHGCYSVVLTLLLLACLPVRQFRAAGAALIVGVIDAAVVLPLYVEDQANGTRAVPAEVLVLSANLNAANRDLDRFVALVRDLEPDLVAVQELSTRARRWIAPLRDLYPFHLERAQDDTYGIAFYSKWPCDDLSGVDFIHNGTTSTVARIRAPSGELLVINTHPYRPGLRGQAKWRDAQLAAIGHYLRDLGGSRPATIVVGDLNTSSWTTGFAQLCELASLRDSRQGFGVQATWPSTLVPFGTAIDHALVSSELVVVDRAVGPSIGSDHRPFIVGVAWRRP